MRSLSNLLLAVAVAATSVGLHTEAARAQQQVALPPPAQQAQQVGQQAKSRTDVERQTAEIRSLIEQLVFDEAPLSNSPPPTPRAGANDDEYAKKFCACREAFAKLSTYKEAAFPQLVAHLKDKRESVPFRNHYLGCTVGDACYWNIYYQLQDRPDNYSRYGYDRIGRDGKDHPQPYWEGTPFDDAGGLAEWLEKHKRLSYAEKQIEYLNWLLAKEKAIGAPDADSYFLNILPLEIRILERKLETGADVGRELKRLRTVLAEKRVDAVPPELLPAATQQRR